MTSSRSDTTQKLQQARLEGRFQEMLEVFQALAPSQVMSVEERELFGIAVRGFIQSSLERWNKVSTAEQQMEDSADEQQRLKAERETIETTATAVLESSALPVVQSQLKLDTDAAHSIFFHTVGGDIHAFLALVAVGDNKHSHLKTTEDYYQTAFDHAKNELHAANPYRLTLALNWSVFLYNGMNHPDKAIQLAKHAFDEAIQDVDTLGEEDKNKSTRLIQQIRDNLTRWTSDDPDGDGRA